MRELEAARNELTAANQQPITPTNITRRQMAADELDRHTLEAIAPSQPLEKVVDALATGLAECCTDHGATAYQRPAKFARQRLDAITQAAYAALHRAAEIRQAQPFEYPEAAAPDPREELIDQLAAALEAARKVLSDAHQYFPKSIRNRATFILLNTEANAVVPALAAATLHQEARRHDQHSLVIDSLRDLRAHCSCGRWNLSCITSDAEPATQIRAHAADAHRLHVEGVRRA